MIGYSRKLYLLFYECLLRLGVQDYTQEGVQFPTDHFSVFFGKGVRVCGLARCTGGFHLLTRHAYKAGLAYAARGPSNIVICSRTMLIVAGIEGPQSCGSKTPALAEFLDAMGMLNMTNLSR